MSEETEACAARDLLHTRPTWSSCRSAGSFGRLVLCAWALALPTACLRAPIDESSATTASATTESDDPTATNSKTSTSGQTTSASESTLTMGATQATQGTESTDTASTSCGFLECDNDLPPHHENCDYHDQRCPEGSKCSFDDDLSRSACFDLSPAPVGRDEPCVEDDVLGGFDECDDKHFCWNEACTPLCDDYDYACPSGYFCLWCQECALGICVLECDPLLDECPLGQICIYTGQRLTCSLDASGEAGAYGDPCAYINECDPGLYCLDAEYVPDCDAASCCTPWCDTDAPECPHALQECIPFFEEGMAPPGREDLGICGVPQP